jgi:hypothetical protein
MHIWSKADIQECKVDLTAGPITSVFISPTSNTRFEDIITGIPSIPSIAPYNPNPQLSNPQPSNPQPTNPNPQEPTLLSARLVGEVAKQYKDDMKYNSSSSFDFKLQMFEDICYRVGFP